MSYAPGGGTGRAESSDKGMDRKLKMLIGSLRNHDANNASRGPRYLNTIESEGNLPTAG